MAMTEPATEEVEAVNPEPNFGREWDGTRWVEYPVTTMTDEAEEVQEERTLSHDLFSTRITCDECYSSNLHTTPGRTFGGLRVGTQWFNYSMLFCPICGNCKPRLITMDENEIGYWRLGLKKIE